MRYILLFFITILHAYHSQTQQDAFIHQNFFPSKKDGIFIEVGAHDGVQISNTLFFEEIGWTGLCIEPIPEVFAQLKNNRKALCIQGCVSDSSGEAQFTRVTGFSEMLSGLSSYYDPRHAQRITDELQKYGGEKKTFSVSCFTLNELLEKNNLRHVDYLSIDTEGGEFAILKSIDFDRFDITVISVENNYGDPEFKKFLTSKGYIFIKRLGVDDIYKKPTYDAYVSSGRPSLYFIKQYLPENPVIVEAGACDGGDTNKLSHTWRSGIIYAFEPSPDAYKKAKYRTRKRKNVKLFPLALGDRIGSLPFYESVSSSPDAKPTLAQGSLFKPSEENWIWKSISFRKPISVPVTTLDAWARKQHVDHVDFLWLDMQGSEFQMLKASPEILKTVKAIQTEVSRKPFYEGTILLDEGKAWLESQGFITIYETPDIHGDALFVRK